MIIFGKLIVIKPHRIWALIFRLIIFIFFCLAMYAIFNGRIALCAPRQWGNCAAVTAEEYPIIFVVLSVIVVGQLLYAYYIFSKKDPNDYENKIK